MGLRSSADNMNNAKSGPPRPPGLPDYDNPPVNEVIVGVQYGPPGDFNAVRLGEVHDLFKSDFPEVQEKPWLEPKLETFGGSGLSSAAAASLSLPAALPRLWFLSEDADHLLQFQKDRLILNWIRRDKEDRYPRFEGIRDTFMGCLGKLRAYYSGIGHGIVLSQVEVAYVNTIPVASWQELSEWLSVGLPSEDPVSSLNFVSEEIMRDEQDRPTSRCYTEIGSMHVKSGAGKAYKLSLTVRGIPRPDAEAASVDLGKHLSEYRCKIVETFDKIITDRAKQAWRRK